MLAFNMLTQRRFTHGTHERLRQEYAATDCAVCDMQLLQVRNHLTLVRRRFDREVKVGSSGHGTYSTTNIAYNVHGFCISFILGTLLVLGSFCGISLTFCS